MAGWKAYTDKLVAGKHCSGAGIYGFNGGCWALSGAGLAPTAAQVKIWITALQDNSGKGAETLRGVGLENGDTKAKGTRYIMLQCNPGDKIVGKKGNAGICITVSGKAIVVGTYLENSGIQPPQCVTAVTGMAADLKGKGF